MFTLAAAERTYAAYVPSTPTFKLGKDDNLYAWLTIVHKSIAGRQA